MIKSPTKRTYVRINLTGDNHMDIDEYKQKTIETIIDSTDDDYIVALYSFAMAYLESSSEP